MAYSALAPDTIGTGGGSKLGAFGPGRKLGFGPGSVLRMTGGATFLLRAYSTACRFPRAPLHSSHAQIQFSMVVNPPLDQGITWSMVAPG
jgi:hypothetical protein